MPHRYGLGTVLNIIKPQTVHNIWCGTVGSEVPQRKVRAAGNVRRQLLGDSEDGAPPRHLVTVVVVLVVGVGDVRIDVCMIIFWRDSLTEHNGSDLTR